jgi:hypothetical protein
MIMRRFLKNLIKVCELIFGELLSAPIIIFVCTCAPLLISLIYNNYWWLLLYPFIVVCITAILTVKTRKYDK